MLNVGLTGGIACGKSTVAEMFVNLGAYLIDFDKLAHEVQEPGGLAWQGIVNHFGRDILGQDKKIDRNKLGTIVFSYPKKLKELNNIIHPCLLEEWRARLEKIKINNPHAIILSDTPLLFEEQMQRMFDLTILVLIPPEEQIRRLMARNSLTQEEAEKRLKSQMPINDKIDMADIIIDNLGTIAETKKKIKEIWNELLKREKHKTEM